MAEPIPGGADPGGPPRSRLRRWLREPLLHFALLGAALFVADQAVGPDRAGPGHAYRIELTEDDLRQLTVTWLAQGRRPPSPEEMRALVENRVREEILYREAVALGLDKDGTIVKRRLAQKMAFLAEDVSGIRDPQPDELRAWFEKNGPRFAQPGRVSFRHVYFSFDRRGEKTRDEAARAVEQLAGKPGDWPGVAKVGDPFMFQDYYGDRTPQQVASVFGARFAGELFALAPGSWHGPIESGYGWHLIWVASSTPGRVPAFEKVEADARVEWVAEQRALATGKAFEAMRGRYEVVLPRAASVAVPAPPPAGATR